MMLVYNTSLSVLGKSGYQNAALLLAAALNILSCLSPEFLFPREILCFLEAIGHLKVR